MSRPRCYLPPSRWQDDPVRLDRDESHHLLDVLRRGRGDALEVFDGEGRIADARLTGTEKRIAVLTLSRTRHVPPPRVAIHLFQALPKTGKMEWVVQKATELGVRRIVPLRCARAVPRWSGDQAAKKTDRWQSVARNAARQCGSAWVPEIAAVADLADPTLFKNSPCTMLWADLRPGTSPLREVLHDLRSHPPHAIGIVVGPEGDFSMAETRLMDDSAWVPVGLGDSVLRTETAAIYIVSICRYEFG